MHPSYEGRAVVFHAHQLHVFCGVASALTILLKFLQQGGKWNNLVTATSNPCHARRHRVMSLLEHGQSIQGVRNQAPGMFAREHHPLMMFDHTGVVESEEVVEETKLWVHCELLVEGLFWGRGGEAELALVWGVYDELLLHVLERLQRDSRIPQKYKLTVRMIVIEGSRQGVNLKPKDSTPGRFGLRNSNSTVLGKW
eukprot:CAMPEP_0206457536 /NCGR_PEP_ID=MMETSP0324_2-20121206/23022_1 /ASSEMBLY_ACC=CAM_ASM_000836 /TAXON_ID=2866 /ORGANISM="Crypthecodinium cohnii, Strain Seligo" /LENGTH=196 /DNA_ID=CAMNT_0053928681 /DNA_START=678 /DNA_END=1265 /DNA_ORIENTATION=+